MTAKGPCVGGAIEESDAIGPSRYEGETYCFCNMGLLKRGSTRLLAITQAELCFRVRGRRFSGRRVGSGSCEVGGLIDVLIGGMFRIRSSPLGLSGRERVQDRRGPEFDCFPCFLALSMFGKPVQSHNSPPEGTNYPGGRSGCGSKTKRRRRHWTHDPD